VTVDDVIDAIVQEDTEDTLKLGGMEALDQPYMLISFGAMIKKRAGWLCVCAGLWESGEGQGFESSSHVILHRFIEGVGLYTYFGS
jgi:hypothetical protein